MTPSLRTVVLWGCVVIGGSLGVATAAVRAHVYGQAVVAVLMAWCVFVMLWGLGQTEQWCDRKQREAEAKAALSELLLAKVRDGDEFNLRLAIPLADHGGTKH